MKRINMIDQTVDLAHLLELAQEGPVLLLMPDGKEFVVAIADDFDQEVSQLRQSVAFQTFLDERSSKQHSRRSLTEVAREIETELTTQPPSE